MRIVPTYKTFFGGNPIHDENLARINSLISTYHDLPTRSLDAKASNETKFISLDEYKQRTNSGNRVKGIHHKELVQKLNRLRSIRAELMPKPVLSILEEFTRKSSSEDSAGRSTSQSLDENGIANTVGKRKDAVANVAMARGNGDILVNGKPMGVYFSRYIDSKKLVYPFQVVAQEAKYNVFVTVSGGGVGGQAEACMYGIAKALVVFNPLLKNRLRKAGLMTRDNRIVERKKPGKVKARKSPTWVKR